MKSSNQCPKCKSTRIIADAKAVDREHGGRERDLTLATFGSPNALIFKDKHTSTVSAWVCATCGFVEYYADSPDSLIIRGE